MVAAPNCGPNDYTSHELAHALAGLDGSARSVVMGAHDEAYRYGSQYVGTGHMLLALATDPSCPIAAALQSRGAGPGAIRLRFERTIGAQAPPSPRVVHLPYSGNAKTVLIGAACRARDSGSATVRGDLWWSLSRVQPSLAAHILVELGELGYVQSAS